MELSQLPEIADSVVKTLAPYLPAVLGLGKKAAEAVAEKVGEDAWGKVKELWGKLRGDEEIARAAKKVAQREGEARENALRSLRDEVELFLERHPEVGTQVASLTQQVISVQSGIAVGGSVGELRQNVFHGPVVVVARDAEKLLSDLGLAEPPRDLRAATDAYLRYLVDAHQNLDFKGMGVTDRVPLRIRLLDMYVPLTARPALPEGEAGERRELLRVAGRELSDEERESLGREIGEPQPVLDLLRENPGLVVLGDPGAGKTTFLKYLALACAAEGGPDLGLENRLPVLVPLAAYAERLAKNDVSFIDFIADYYRGQNIELPLEPMLRQTLAAGGCLVLFDGLDEVRDPAARRLVVGHVSNFFTLHAPRGNKLVITSRIVGYREVRPNVEGLAECTLLDFGKEEIDEFAERWTAAVERAAGGDGPVARRQAEEEKRGLLDAVRRSPGVRKLASNPLMLTILALMKRQGVVLPDRRVELYKRYLDTLLKSWNLARGLDPRHGHGMDEKETVQILAPLALWMQRTAPGKGLVGERDLRRELEKIYAERGAEKPADEAERFLNDVRQHAALLLDRGGRRFGFLHLTFQEYLAAVALADLGPESVAPVIDALRTCAAETEPSWREVFLLTVGYVGIVQERPAAASSIVRGLLQDDGGGEPGSLDGLVGEAVADCGPAGVTPQCWGEVADRMATTMRDYPRVHAPHRVAAARSLARLGDPRPEVTTLDGMQFCRVAAGAFRMGSDEDPEERFLLKEAPAKRVEIPYDCWVGHYPVTVEQWREYVAASGVEPGDGDSLNGRASEPVRRVTWFEARDFCTWLGRRWAEAGWMREGWSVRLPSEAEWEKAARGGERLLAEPLPPQTVVKLAARQTPKEEWVDNEDGNRVFPWGEGGDSERANFALNIGEVSPVGCYPGGAGPYGCEEMSGNVWEWTRSLVGDYPYPVPGDDREKRESPSGDAPRVLRGGSFYSPPRDARCAVRDRYHPSYRDRNIGFRVMLSPFSLTSEASDL